jgi:hypothetical protein
MRAAVIDSLERGRRFAEPIVAEGETLIEVTAAGLHPIVRMLTSGEHYGSQARPPVIPGIDGTGRAQDGTRVYFSGVRPPHGPMAQRAADPFVLPLPDGLDEVTAAAIVNPGNGAWLALTRQAALQPGKPCWCWAPPACPAGSRWRWHRGSCAATTAAWPHSTAAQVGRLWRLGRAYTTVICWAPGYAHDSARPGRELVSATHGVKRPSARSMSPAVRARHDVPPRGVGREGDRGRGPPGSRPPRPDQTQPPGVKAVMSLTVRSEAGRKAVLTLFAQATRSNGHGRRPLMS